MKNSTVKTLVTCGFVLSILLFVWFDGHSKSDVAPQRIEVIGTWIFDSKRVATSSQITAVPEQTILKLKRDGSFTLCDTVQFWKPDATGYFSRPVNNASGRWSLGYDLRMSYVSLTFQTIEGQPEDDFKEIQLLRQSDGLRLQVRVGDPDQYEWIKFKKQK